MDPKMGVSWLRFICSHDSETETEDKYKSRYIKAVFVSNHGNIMNAMIRVKAHKKKKYGDKRRKKWGEDPNTIDSDIKTEGDGKIMDIMLWVEVYAAVLTMIERNYISTVGMMLYLAGYTCPDIAYAVATFYIILHLEDWYDNDIC